MTAVAAKHAEIAKRYKAKAGRKAPTNIVGVMRIAELRRLFFRRCGHTLTDDDAGREYALLMAHHIAKKHGGSKKPDRARHYIGLWMGLNAPWLQPEEINRMIADVLARPLRWRADELAQELRLTEAERSQLGIRTIGAVDMTKAKRKLARKLRQRDRDRARRRRRGAKPRDEYEAASISRNKPWIAASISRATWYRQNRPA